MKLNKGLSKGETMFLATLKEEAELSKSKVPKEIKKALEEFKDVMPSELPNKLPQRREADHEIELET